MAETQASPPPVLGNPGELCCGARHAPYNAGKPLVLACQLCDQASVYYRNEPVFQERQAYAAEHGSLPERFDKALAPRDAGGR